jgi:hypothetical protein
MGLKVSVGSGVSMSANSCRVILSFPKSKSASCQLKRTTFLTAVAWDLPFVELDKATVFTPDFDCKRVFLCHLRLLIRTEKREWVE